MEEFNDKEEQLLKRKELILKLQNDIEEIKYDIDHIAMKNFKIRLLKKIHQSKYLLPYIATLGLNFGIYSALGDKPFIIDNEKKYLETKKEIDSLGNVSYENQYEHYNTVNYISYISSWQKESDSTYSREVKNYIVRKLDEEAINDFFENFDNDENYNLDQIFGKPILIQTQTKNNLTEEEIKQNAFLKAIMFSQDKKDYIVVSESKENNLKTSIYWVIFTLFAETIPYIWLKDKHHDTEDIELLNKEELKKKLEIRLNNYKRLTR